MLALKKFPTVVAIAANLGEESGGGSYINDIDDGEQVVVGGVND